MHRSPSAAPRLALHTPKEKSDMDGRQEELI
jgi:hypothetical protein